MSLCGHPSTLGKEQHLLSCATNSAKPFPPRNLLGLYRPKGSYAQTEAEEKGTRWTRGKKKVNLNDFHTVLCRTAIYLHGFIHLFNSLPSTGLLTKSPAHFISIYILLSASLAWALY